MKKVIVKIKKEKILFSYKEEDKDFVDLNDNTNIISNNNLVFNEIYFKKNTKIISYFINGILKENELTSVGINDFKLIDSVLDIISKIERVKKLYILCDEKLTYENCEKILNNKHLEYLECYDMPDFMFDRINDKNYIKIDIRCEIISNSNFITNNKLGTFSNIYYENVLFFTTEIKADDIKDFETFCKINRKLGKIIITKFDKIGFDKIIKILLESSIRNVKILIYTDDFNFDSISKEINYLKETNKMLKKKNIKIKLNYDDGYKADKIIKQVNLSGLKIAGIIIIILSLIIIGYNEYNKYQSRKSIDDVQKIVEKDIINWNEEVSNAPAPEQKEGEKKQLSENYEELLKINSDTVGWLKVNGTDVNYPVVKYSDNDHYLGYGFYKYKNVNGWIFMDYRNSIDKFSTNTIIYGHNIRGTNLMFASLHNTLKQSWFNDKSNHIIKFNSINKEYNWQIFSISVIEPLVDYLQTEYDRNGGLQNFIDTIKNRSIYDFGVEVTPDDKILTLSTCAEKGTKRLVIHAKLLQ